MPKIKEFDLSSYTDSQYRSILIEGLQKKLKTLSVHGAKAKDGSRIWGIEISDEDFAAFKNSDKAKSLLRKEYEQKVAEAKESYAKLKKKLDFCLKDVKSYTKLCEVLDDFTYCGAIEELQTFEKRYLQGNSPSKAVYRARLKDYYKIDCA